MGQNAIHPSKQINDVIADGKVEVNQGQVVPVEIYLGGDYKVRNNKLLK